MSKHIFLFVLLALVHGCGPSGPANRPDPDPVNYASACKKLQDLKCPEGEDIVIPSSDGGADSGTRVTCTAWCEETQNNGHALNAGCVMGIATCADLTKCDW